MAVSEASGGQGGVVVALVSPVTHRGRLIRQLTLRVPKMHDAIAFRSFNLATGFIAFAARLAGQPDSVIRGLCVRDLAALTDAVSKLVEETFGDGQ